MIGQTISHLRRCLTATLAVGLYVCSLHGQIPDVLKSAQIDTLFARTEESLTVKRTPTYGVVFQVAEGKPGRYQIYEEADEIWFVRSGRAGLSMGPRLSSAREVEPGKLVGAGIQTPRRFEVAAGDIVNLPRGTAHQLDPGNDRFEYVVVRVFPTDAHPVRRFQNPSPMGDVLKHSERAAVFANNNSNQPLHSVRNVSVNYVIYQGHPGPWEAHRGCIDVYFVYTGSGVAHLGGTIVNAEEAVPGEIRGTGVTGARKHELGPGDIVLIPRDTAHYVVPTSEKLGYNLVKVWAQ